MRKVYFIEKIVHDHEIFVYDLEKFDEASMKRRWSFDDGIFVAMCKWALRHESQKTKGCTNLVFLSDIIAVQAQIPSYMSEQVRNLSSAPPIAPLFS